MDPCLPVWVLWLLLLLPLPTPGLALSPAPAPATPEKLCGHQLLRALVRACGGPSWSPEVGRDMATGGDRE